MVSSLTRNQVRRKPLRVRLPCPPLIKPCVTKVTQGFFRALRVAHRRGVASVICGCCGSANSARLATGRRERSPAVILAGCEYGLDLGVRSRPATPRDGQRPVAGEWRPQETPGDRSAGMTPLIASRLALGGSFG